MSRQLQFVCGKGGVGKSVVSCALARAFRAQGHRVLLAQVNAADTHQALLGSGPIGHEMREIEPGFSVVNISPPAAMKEYALMTLRFEAVYRTVFENRITKVFLRFVPSLNEMVILGKLWFHAEENEDGRPRFDRIVVDTPATGHGLKLLSVARIVHDAARIGPMAEKTRLMAQLVEDPRRTALHVVTLPEELPVSEAFDLCRIVREKRTAPLGVVFINQVLPTLFSQTTEDALARVRAEASEGASSLVAVADARRLRERIEVQQRTRVLDLGLPLLELPRVLASPLLPSHVETLTALVAPHVRRPA